jgi:AraC family ethanolamine operon transcriptional activator
MIRRHIEVQESEVLADMAHDFGFDIHCDQLEPGRLDGVIDFAGTADARFFRDRFSRVICNHGAAPKDMVAFAFPETAAKSAIFCGEVVTPWTFSLIAAGGEYSYRAPPNHGIFRGCFAADRLDRVLHSLHHTSLAQAIGETRNVEISVAAMARMRSIMQAAVAPPRHPDLVPDNDALDRATEDGMLTALCVALTANTPPRYTSLAARNHWRCVRKALNYIETHLGGPLRMETLCLFTGVSWRTLEAAFHTVTGFSPLHFIKVRRLNAARHALKIADPMETSVKAITLNLGIHHFGHFAHDYKTHFGESPSTTLSHP